MENLSPEKCFYFKSISFLIKPFLNSSLGILIPSIFSTSIINLSRFSIVRSSCKDLISELAFYFNCKMIWLLMSMVYRIYEFVPAKEIIDWMSRKGNIKSLALKFSFLKKSKKIYFSFFCILIFSYKIKIQFYLLNINTNISSK